MQTVPRPVSDADPRRLRWTDDIVPVYAHDPQLPWKEAEMAARAELAEAATEQSRNEFPQSQPPSPAIYKQQFNAANTQHKKLGCTGVPVYAKLPYFRCVPLQSPTANITSCFALCLTLSGLRCMFSTVVLLV